MSWTASTVHIRLSATNSREPACAPEITVDSTLDAGRNRAGNQHVAGRIVDAVLLEAAVSHHHSSTLDKSAAFRSDPRFATAIQGGSSDTRRNSSASPDGISWRP